MQAYTKPMRQVKGSIREFRIRALKFDPVQVIVHNSISFGGSVYQVAGSIKKREPTTSKCVVDYYGVFHIDRMDITQENQYPDATIVAQAALATKEAKINIGNFFAVMRSLELAPNAANDSVRDVTIKEISWDTK